MYKYVSQSCQPPYLYISHEHSSGLSDVHFIRTSVTSKGKPGGGGVPESGRGGMIKVRCRRSKGFVSTHYKTTENVLCPLSKVAEVCSYRCQIMLLWH